jgi:hypothetical protein
VQDLYRYPEKLKVYSFFYSGLDLLFDGRHLRLCAAVEDGGIRAEAAANASCVDCGVATADDHDVISNIYKLAVECSVQKLRAGHDVWRVLARDAEATTRVGADGQEDCVEFTPQSSESDIRADPFIGLELHSDATDAYHLSIQHLSRQPIGRNTPT